jgi:hypothetical protein
MSQPLPAHRQGQSWAPYLMAGAEPPARDVMVEWNGAPWPPKEMAQHCQPLGTILAPEGWKMTLAPRGYGLLYDLRTDREERRNLFYRAGSRETIRELAARVNLWQSATGDAPILFDETEWGSRRRQLQAAGVADLD